MRNPKQPPPCESARKWLKIRRGRHCLGVLTGGTSRAFSAYLHLVDCWLSGRDPRITEALRQTVATLQRSEWPLAAEAIACLGDWSHIEELWEQIRPPGAPMFAYHAESDRVLQFDEEAVQ